MALVSSRWAGYRNPRGNGLGLSDNQDIRTFSVVRGWSRTNRWLPQMVD